MQCALLFPEFLRVNGVIPHSIRNHCNCGITEQNINISLNNIRLFYSYFFHCGCDFVFIIFGMSAGEVSKVMAMNMNRAGLYCI